MIVNLQKIQASVTSSKLLLHFQISLKFTSKKPTLEKLNEFKNLKILEHGF